MFAITMHSLEVSACLLREDVSPALVDGTVNSIELPPGEWPGRDVVVFVCVFWCGG